MVNIFTVGSSSILCRFYTAHLDFPCHTHLVFSKYYTFFYTVRFQIKQKGINIRCAESIMSHPTLGKNGTHSTTSSKPASVAGSTTSSAAERDPAEHLKKLETKLKAMYVRKPIALATTILHTVNQSNMGKADPGFGACSNANNVARTANAHLTSADESLYPLVSLKTGRAIDRFPDTPRGIAKLSGMYSSDKAGFPLLSHPNHSLCHK